jgi:hypothetical protein
MEKRFQGGPFVVGQGSGTRKKVGGGALGLIGGPVGALVSTAVSQARDAQLDEAVQQAVASASAGVVNAAVRLARAQPQMRTDGLAPSGN